MSTTGSLRREVPETVAVLLAFGVAYIEGTPGTVPVSASSARCRT